MGERAALSQYPALGTQHLPLLVALVALLVAPAAFAQSDIRFLNPDGLFKPGTFSQIAITSGDTVVYISGQTARDESSNVVGAGDVRKQAEKVFENLQVAVEAAGGWRTSRRSPRTSSASNPTTGCGSARW
jgi:enamine deaminase RidA (YjgF/YER057c/UK114 family)